MLNWKGLFRSHILERGWDYASDGSVTDLVKTDDSTHWYRVLLTNCEQMLMNITVLQSRQSGVS